jgi:hypothetical protein
MLTDDFDKRWQSGLSLSAVGGAIGDRLVADGDR